MKRILQSFLFVTVITITTLSWAGSLTIPHHFTTSDTEIADELNANFDAIATAVNDNDARVAALEAQVASLQATVNQLQSVLAAVQANSVLDLDGYLILDRSGVYRKAVFQQINVQVVNGLNQTDTVNGLGNLIIGYDEVNTSERDVCSYGAYFNQGDCEANGYTWAVNHKSGSHYIIAGAQNNYSQYGGAVFGYGNTSNREWANVSGGHSNIASGVYTSVNGGSHNGGIGFNATVSGGSYNFGSGFSATVSGGHSNIASGFFSSVSGGILNTASGGYSSVSGGRERRAIGTYDWVAGGLFQNK